MKTESRTAMVYGTRAGMGGLGHSAAMAITALAQGESSFALGPGAAVPWSLAGPVPAVEWLESPAGPWPWMGRYSPLRWKPGDLCFLRDRSLGRWAAREIRKLRPSYCYLFTQVALETLRWARAEGIPTAIDNPNGHIRNFQQVCEREAQRWFGKKYRGHPSAAMLERIEEEYQLADRIRVYAPWGRASMQDFGVAADKIHVLRQAINLERFHARRWNADLSRPGAGRGPLRVCYVGSLDLRKGFVYLLQAIRAVGAASIRLRIIGATGDADCHKLLVRESAGLQVTFEPGDSIPVYQESELLVIPTLEDGLPFVLVEGLACGLPVIVTDQAGAAECVEPGRNGWIVPAAEVEPLAAALEDALSRRDDLPEMGRHARAAVEKYAAASRMQELSEWFYKHSRSEVYSRA